MLETIANVIRQEKELNRVFTGKEEVQMSSFPVGKPVFVEHLSQQIRLDVISSNKIVNLQSQLSYINSKQVESKLKL